MQQVSPCMCLGVCMCVFCDNSHLHVSKVTIYDQIASADLSQLNCRSHINDHFPQFPVKRILWPSPRRNGRRLRSWTIDRLNGRCSATRCSQKLQPRFTPIGTNRITPPSGHCGEALNASDSTGSFHNSTIMIITINTNYNNDNISSLQETQIVVTLWHLSP